MFSEADNTFIIEANCALEQCFKKLFLCRKTLPRDMTYLCMSQFQEHHK